MPESIHGLLTKCLKISSKISTESKMEAQKDDKRDPTATTLQYTTTLRFPYSLPLPLGHHFYLLLRVRRSLTVRRNDSACCKEGPSSNLGTPVRFFPLRNKSDGETEKDLGG
jgi:hypothetical protein